MPAAQSLTGKTGTKIVKTDLVSTRKSAATRVVVTAGKIGKFVFAKGHAPDYAAYFKAAPLDRVTFVKTGVPADQAKAFLTHLDAPSHRLYDALDLKVSTFNRKALKKDFLSADEAERVMGLVKLFGQVETMVQESGNSEGFDPAVWTLRWLEEPLPALGGRTPMELMDTMEGQALVSDTLAKVQSGAYA